MKLQMALGYADGIANKLEKDEAVLTVPETVILTLYKEIRRKNMSLSEIIRIAKEMEDELL